MYTVYSNHKLNYWVLESLLKFQFLPVYYVGGLLTVDWYYVDELYTVVVNISDTGLLRSCTSNIGSVVIILSYSIKASTNLLYLQGGRKFRSICSGIEDQKHGGTQNAVLKL